MKTFAQKLGRSLWAMTCGWMACNVVLTVSTIEQSRGEWRTAVYLALVYGLYSAVVILAACLVVFLPVDLLLPDHSMWRKPGPAAFLGLVAGTCAPLVLIWCLTAGSRSWSLDGFLTAFHWSVLPWLLSPGVTGMVAALVRSRKRVA